MIQTCLAWLRRSREKFSIRDDHTKTMISSVDVEPVFDEPSVKLCVFPDLPPNKSAAAQATEQVPTAARRQVIRLSSVQVHTKSGVGADVYGEEDAKAEAGVTRSVDGCRTSIDAELRRQRRGESQPQMVPSDVFRDRLDLPRRLTG